MVRSIGVLLLASTLVLALHPVVGAERENDQVAITQSQSDTRVQDKEPSTEFGPEGTGGFPDILPPSGPTDAELQSERPHRSWLPPEETGLGMPQSATGGGFPDRSMRTGAFGFDTGIPGAGGTRAGR